MRRGFLNPRPKPQASNTEPGTSNSPPSSVVAPPPTQTSLPDDPVPPAERGPPEIHDFGEGVVITWADILTGEFDMHETLKNMLQHKVFKDNPPRFEKSGKIIIETDEEKLAILECAVPWIPIPPSAEAARWNLPPQPVSEPRSPFLESLTPTNETFQHLLDRVLKGPDAPSSRKVHDLKQPPLLDYNNKFAAAARAISSSFIGGTSSTPTWVDELYGHYKERQQIGILNYMAPLTGSARRQAADGSIPVASERLMTDFTNKLMLEIARLDLDPRNATVFAPLKEARDKRRRPVEGSIAVTPVGPGDPRTWKAALLVEKPNVPPSPVEPEPSQTSRKANIITAPSLPNIPLNVPLSANDPRIAELLKRAPVLNKAQLEAITGSEIISKTVAVLLPGPEGRHCSCLLKEGVKEYLEALPSFQPLREIQNAPMYTISVKGEGLGVVATQLIRTGDLIMTERPLMVKPRVLIWDNDSGQQELQSLLDRLDAKEQSAFMDLHNCKASSFGEVYGRILTNDVAIGLSSDEKKSYGGIFKDFSRCNHSCAPNATYDFNLTTFALELHATRNIQPSEEICISYVELLHPRSKRRSDLLKYTFNCMCRICALSPELSAESDARRSGMGGWYKDHISFEKWLKNKETPENQFLEETQMLLDMAETEGLEGLVSNYVKSMADAYAALGREKQYKKWAEKARRLLLASGESPEPYDTAATNPTAHKLWGTRQIK